jgi:cysteine/O-acetylserine efflux protein
MFNWASFLPYAIITAITPGPNNILSLTNASRNGLRRAWPLTLGIFAGFTVVTLICTVFCGVLTSIVPAVKLPMMVLGAAYMLYLAYKTWHSGAVVEGDARQTGFWQGFALQFLNPKIFIYSIVSMQVYIMPVYANNMPLLLMFAVFLSGLGALCTLLWALFGAAFKLLFARYAKITNTIMALLLVYCAVSLFL